MMMKTNLYVQIGKPLEFKRFNMMKVPIGWYRIDLLKKKLKEDKKFRAKFNKEEIKEIFKRK